MNKNMSFRSSKDSKANSKVSSGNSFKVTASRTIEHPDHVTSYFRAEWLTLLIITISGLIYNIGLLAGPWFEGQLAQMLYENLRRNYDIPEAPAEETASSEGPAPV